MAKKKAARAPHKVNGKAAKPRAVRSPRQKPLPGMGQVRHDRLDDLCVSIGDAREVMNNAKADVESGSQAALDYMALHNLTIYKHAGIELVRVPGHDALRVRLVKGASDVEVTAGEGAAAEA